MQSILRSFERVYNHFLCNPSPESAAAVDKVEQALREAGFGEDELRMLEGKIMLASSFC